MPGNKKFWFIIMAILLFILVLTAITALVERLFKAEEAAPVLEFASERTAMVEHQIIPRGVADKAVLSTMKTIPRHLFVPENVREDAYKDHPLPIGYGQTISQPYMVALMTEALELEGGERVLEIGTGSGYQAAVLSELVEQVYTIEIIGELASSANNTLKNLGYENVEVKHADGYFGWEEHAPFDAVMITAAANHIPPPLLEQLKDGGKLIVPLGSTVSFQTLTLVTKRGEDLDTKFLGSVRFVPMTGEVLRRQG